MLSSSYSSVLRQRMSPCRRLRFNNFQALTVTVVCMALLTAPFCDAFFDFIFGQYFKFRAPGKMPVGSQYTEDSEVDKHDFAIEQLVSPHAVPFKNTTSNLYGIMIDAGKFWLGSTACPRSFAKHLQIHRWKHLNVYFCFFYCRLHW